MTFKANLLPDNTAAQRELGSSTQKWKINSGWPVISVTTTGTGNAITAITESEGTLTVTKGASYNNYSHPTYTSKSLGLYKLQVDGTGHVSNTAAITKSDITGLGLTEVTLVTWASVS